MPRSRVAGPKRMHIFIFNRSGQTTLQSSSHNLCAPQASRDSSFPQKNGNYSLTASVLTHRDPSVIKRHRFQMWEAPGRAWSQAHALFTPPAPLPCISPTVSLRRSACLGVTGSAVPYTAGGFTLQQLYLSHCFLCYTIVYLLAAFT